MRAWGRGWKICWLQFIKSKTANYGETRAAARMGIEMIPLGDGFTWLSKDIEHDIALARECWALAREKIESGAYDLVVLDEITYPITLRLARRGRGDRGAARAPGRRAPDPHGPRRGAEELAEFADLVTEMTEVKHPFRQGIKAQPGLDF